MINHAKSPVCNSGLNVLAVIPGVNSDSIGMVFARRQMCAIEGLGFNVHRFFFSTRTALSGIVSEFRRLKAEIRLFNPDVIYCHYGTITAFITVCATSRPVVIAFRGSDLNPVPSVSSLRVFVGHTLSQLSALRATRIVCVSRGLMDRLLWSKDKVTLIPTGVDTSLFKPIPISRARECLGWAGDDIVVLFNAGREPRVKRIDLAEQAIVQARELLPKLKLFVLDGDIDPVDVPLYHNAADALLVTSDFEGSPTIVQEAIACGLPVVSVDVGDVTERLREVAPSRIVPRDSAAIASALVQILTLRQRSNGPEVAGRELAYSVLLPQVVKVLCNAANQS